MAVIENYEYFCDNCGKKVLHGSNLNIVTDKSENEYSQSWERLHVVIIRKHGMHNDGVEDNANLCKKCAVILLEDALKRVKKGERASKGTESSNLEKWKNY